ncbi:MAG: C-methyltransferase [Parcubacteria group bacterium Gr01-1014_38]|nr:MAG: C-methyltransferase [Parcubacteria group bacterium Gr01-1014_38]
MGCRNCATTVTKFFSLGEIPLGNGFLTKEEIPHERTYDLSVGFCRNCYLTQLTKALPRDTLYRKMFYFPSAFEGILDARRARARDLAKRLRLNARSLVLDIGSNDGSQLQFFKKLGTNVLGVDPARNMAEMARRQSIPTIGEFFDWALARKLLAARNLRADLIVSLDLLNHVEDIKDFLKGVKLLLKPKGTAFFEFFLQRELDIINHEHVYYFSLLSLKSIFGNVQLQMYDADVHNGALRIYVSHPNVFPESARVRHLITQEISAGFDKLETYQRFARDITNRKAALVALLRSLKARGQRIAGYSAPEKGNVLLNYCGIGENYLDFIADMSALKQGLYTPGTHLLVYPPEKVYQAKPDYLLILCWNIAPEIIRQFRRYHAAGGRFILPVPTVKVL